MAGPGQGFDRAMGILGGVPSPQTDGTTLFTFTFHPIAIDHRPRDL
jgi:hypothetical protein